METTERRVSPQELYHAAWRAARAAFYERSRLEDWAYWENRFDHLMRDDEDAYRYIGEMLASLRDNYTFLKTPQVVRQDDLELERAPSPVESRMLANGIGYLKIYTFNHSRFCDELFEALRRIEHARAFIVDLRGNKGGFIDAANNAISMFCDRARVMICEKSVGYLDREGFYAEYFDGRDNLVGSKKWNRYRNVTGNKPIYVLIDETCASSTELFAGILADNDRVTLVGRQTYGKGISQYTHSLPNGCGLRITSGVILPPSRQWFGDDRQTYANGVRPHIWVNHDPDYRGDLIADVTRERLMNDLAARERSNSNGFWAVGAFGLGLALLAGTRRAA
jgi:C-terminal processing protease CtpA/Prc